MQFIVREKNGKETLKEKYCPGINVHVLLVALHLVLIALLGEFVSKSRHYLTKASEGHEVEMVL